MQAHHWYAEGPKDADDDTFLVQNIDQEPGFENFGLGQVSIVVLGKFSPNFEMCSHQPVTLQYWHSLLHFRAIFSERGI